MMVPFSLQCIFVGISLWLFRKWLNGGICKSKARIDGKTVVITGANTGIGFETALELAKRGGKIIMACRDTDKGHQAMRLIRNEVPTSAIYVMHCNLSSLTSVRQFAQEVQKNHSNIHILINNAGCACTPQLKTEDGFELQFGANHLSHFLLTNLLLDRIKESAPARIINVSSIAHTRGKIHFDDINFEQTHYNPFVAYFQSKLANVLFTKQLSLNLKGTGVTVYCLHPGAVQTGLGRYLGDSLGQISAWAFYFFSLAFFKTPVQGMQTTLHCAVSDSAAKETGLYYSDCKPIKPAKQGNDLEAAQKLWKLSEEMVKLT